MLYVHISDMVSVKKLGKSTIEKNKKKKLKKIRKENSKSKCDEALGNGGDEGEEIGELMDANDEIASDEENVVEAVTSGNAGKKHLSDLQKLKESDPEFYKFLQQQDADLLQFHASDEEDEEVEAHFEDGEEEDLVDEEREDYDETAQHLPKAKKDSSGRLIFDGRMLDHLQSVLDPEDQKRRIQVEDVRFAVEAFNACVSRVGADIDLPKYIINEQVAKPPISENYEMKNISVLLLLATVLLADF
ncbi:hypothetical protein TELCIR_11836 [Teladorsagia circumcincta]|uniref:Uncharacterized protein n=1 Tax=Teladorsagia circumcincta TaxID=45464 RepID=A0A2G9U837_TELCI|nr:hypothetical protein TELCIR_11836 [Teladorsagia circumcincta]